MKINEAAKKVIDQAELDLGLSLDRRNQVYGYLSTLPEIYVEGRREARWWHEVLRVVQVGDHKIGFIDAETTGDENAEEKGWIFDESSICEVEPYEETVVKYREKQ